MQYLLTEEELMEMKGKIESLSRLPSVNKLQKFCTNLADTMPVKLKYAPNGVVWRCIITVAEKENSEDKWYCDECPAREVCPYPHKKFSK